MRLQELFETTEEDRALISLSSSIYEYIQRYADEDPDEDEDEYDPDFDHIPTDMKSIHVGTIGRIFDTPIDHVGQITIEMQSSDGIQDRLNREEADDSDITRGPRGEILGLWYGHNSTIVLNKDYLGSNALKSVITHELRHALDDFKSNYEANKDGGRYSTPKNKSYRKVTNDPHMGNLRYLAEPAEINARFVQVLHNLVPVISRAAKLPSDQGRNLIMSSFKKAMSHHNIEHLFPEKEKSRDYKRLIKRGMDFIQKELAHATQIQK